ncbi:hypothetical protein CDAR_242481 [Caerostris darwini]|uniref:Uncharacterized protein n=1 Tax=Caerostris darwini TaxID=1538125 RepID=A0AAV4UN55_9ARAC|nr:hypothetical protein CDAR_242481 [Caerostris darwini]
MKGSPLLANAHISSLSVLQLSKYALAKPSSYILSIVKQFCENLSLPMRRNPHFGLRNYSSLQTACLSSSDRGLILVIKLPRINRAGHRNYLATSSPPGRCYTSLQTAMMNFNSNTPAF